MKGSSILLIEDEPALQSTLDLRLRDEGYIVETANNGTEGFRKATTSPFDLIILCVMLPDRSGFDVCRDIRQAGLATPILFLTARDRTADKVIAFKLGADDYVTKPFKMAELIPRIEALLSRVPIRSGYGVHQFGSIRVDVRGAKVTRDGKPVYLSGREFQLLLYLIERSGSTVPSDELLRSIIREDTLTRTVASLRTKLGVATPCLFEENPKRPEFMYEEVRQKFEEVRQKFGLTPQELDIVSAVVEGYSNKEIAEYLKIGEDTVKRHLINIFDKVGVSSKLELGLFAVDHGLPLKSMK